MKRGQRLTYRISFQYPDRPACKDSCPEGAWQAVKHSVELLERGARVEIQKRREDLTWRTLYSTDFNDRNALDFLSELEDELLPLLPREGNDRADFRLLTR